MIIYILGLQQVGKSEIARQLYSAVNDNVLCECQPYIPTFGQEIFTIHMSSKCNLLQLAINSSDGSGDIDNARNGKKKENAKMKCVSVELREIGGAMMANWVDFITSQVQLSTNTTVSTKAENAQICVDKTENGGAKIPQLESHAVKQTICTLSTLFALIYVVDATQKDQLHNSIDTFCHLACNADSVCVNWPILIVLNKCVGTNNFTVDGADKVDSTRIISNDTTTSTNNINSKSVNMVVVNGVDDHTVLSLDEVEHAFLQVNKTKELNCIFMEVDLACGMGLGDMVYWIYNTSCRGVKEVLEELFFLFFADIAVLLKRCQLSWSEDLENHKEVL